MILLGAAAVASWFYGLPEPVAAPRRSNGDDAPPGYYLRGARLLGADASGRVAYESSADRLEEQPDQERLILAASRSSTAPRTRFRGRLRRAAGSAPKGGAVSTSWAGWKCAANLRTVAARFVIIADRLRFAPDHSSAESDAPVELGLGDNVLTGRGLNDHLKEDRVELESEVHGRFAP